MTYLPPDKRALQILSHITMVLPNDMENKEDCAKKLMARQIDNIKELLRFTAASLKDKVYWEIVKQQSLKL